MRASVECGGRLESRGASCEFRCTRPVLQAVHVADGRWHVVELSVRDSKLCVSVDAQACDEPTELGVREVRELRFQFANGCVDT